MNYKLSTFYDMHPKFPRPFGYRIRIVMEEYGIAQYKVQPCRFSPACPWKLACVEFCRAFLGNKKDVPDVVIHREFLKHMEEHSNAVFIFTDGSKTNAGIGFGAVSQDFNCY